MIDSIITNPNYGDYTREIEFGDLKSLINKYIQNDIYFVVYKLSYSGKFIYIKGKSLAGSLIIFTDTLNSFKKEKKDRFSEHLYTHMYNHIIECPGGRFTANILAFVDRTTSFYDLLKKEQMMLNNDRYNSKCLNNQTEVYIPNYNESTRMFGWIPADAVRNYKKWIKSVSQ